MDWHFPDNVDERGGYEVMNVLDLFLSPRCTWALIICCLS